MYFVLEFCFVAITILQAVLSTEYPKSTLHSSNTGSKTRKKLLNTQNLASERTPAARIVCGKTSYPTRTVRGNKGLT
ncbi:hypothetical protein GQ44DRAFT_80427 [Phaeosphaeriaceae sp. PMI808]|nr:hypothetical protein GQ44DRAFT_80427 [Phaeosphaeriaceae sp. PMI808]